MSRILVKDVRLAFPVLWVAKAIEEGGEKAFSCSLLLPPNHPQLAAIRGAMKSAAVEKWGAKADAIYKALVAADKVALHNGDAKADYDGFPGNLFISCRSKVRPSVFDGQKNPLTEADGVIYAGCYVNASIEFWGQENSWGKRLNAQICGVQKKRDGDAFAGGAKAADADEFPEELGVDEGEPDQSGVDPLMG